MKYFYSLLVSIPIIFFLSGNNEVSAQPTTIKLPTDNNLSSFNLTNKSNATMMKLAADGGFYLGGTAGAGTIPIQGEGTRLLWHPAKAAFRAGKIEGYAAAYWDDSNVGMYSVAFGGNTRASGNHSFASGSGTTASGKESVAMGNGSTASGDRSLSFNGTASSAGAICLGSGAQATSDDAVAIGPSSISGGLASVTIGPSLASGNFAVAIGLQNRAGGHFSTVIGKNARASHTGAMVLGDGSASFSSDSVYSTGNNTITMRFVGGYKLYTAVNLLTGVSIPAGGSSWSTISDSTKKENFIKSDGESFLKSLSTLKLGSWNYKAQDPQKFRHYGPMAQEIFSSFGNDKMGTIGNDTTLASADMDGIMMICLQALEKRTSELKKANDENIVLAEKVTELEKILMAQKTVIDNFRNELHELKKTINKNTEGKKFVKGSLKNE